MPFLDCSDVLLDPDFCDPTLICQRNPVSANNNGRGVFTGTQTLPFTGVVTSDKGELLARGMVGEHATGAISIITRFMLIDAGTGMTADIVQWNGKQYTVTKVNDYSTYGIGFIEAIAELIPLAG